MRKKEAHRRLSPKEEGLYLRYLDRMYLNHLKHLKALKFIPHDSLTHLSPSKTRAARKKELAAANKEKEAVKARLENAKPVSANVELELLFLAVRTDPNSAVAHYNLGELLYRLNRHEEAVVACNEAIRLDPEHSAAKRTLISSCLSLQRYDDVIDKCLEVLEKNPHNIHALTNLALAYSRDYRFAEAIETLEDMLRMYPENKIQIRILIASVYMLARDKDSTMREYNILKGIDEDAARKLLNSIEKLM